MFGIMRRLFARARKPQPRRARPRVEALEDRAVPATAFALTSTNTLLRFDTASPTVTQPPLAVTGLTAGDVLRGIDFVPDAITGPPAFARDTLFAVSTDAGNTLVRVYTINTTTGAATLLGSSTDAQVTDGATGFGVDFNPTNRLLRITSDLNDNISFNPVTNAFTAQTLLSPASADIVGSAYDRNDTDTGTGTTLFGIDFTTDTLVIQGGVNGTISLGPQGGVLSTLGALGVDTDANVGFDIVGLGNGPGVTGDGPGFAALHVGGVSRLYTINLGTGAATLVGTIGNGTATITGLAILTTTPAPLTQPPVPQSLTIAPVLGFQGRRMAFADVNNDGIIDIIVGAGPGRKPRVTVVNGANGTVLNTFLAYGNSSRSGVFVAVGDLNGDGVLEIVTGPGKGRTPFVRIFNAQTGAPVGGFLATPFRAVNGAEVAVLDVNGDGRPDIITKTRLRNGLVVLGFFNGSNQALLYNLFT